MTIRQFTLESKSPPLVEVLSKAEELSPLQIDSNKLDEDSTQISFAGIDGSIEVYRDFYRIEIEGHWASAPILMDLRDLTIRQTGGVQKSTP